MLVRTHFVPCLAVLLLAPRLAARDETPGAPPAPAAPPVASASTDGSAAAALPEDESPAVTLEQKTLKTLFKNLRFDEDWSALKDPETQTDHWFPGMKYVEMTDGSYASFGGQVRARWAAEQNRNLKGGVVPHNNDYELLRMRLHGDFHIENVARVFVELISAHILDRDAPPAPSDRNQLDFENLFVELLGDGYVLRGGRFEMSYGAQRLVGSGDWANIRRQFEGVLARIKSGDWSTDIFMTSPMVVNDDHKDKANTSRDFEGVYSTLKIDANTGLDLYGLRFDEDGHAFTDSNGSLGGQDCRTVGARYWGKQDAMDYEAEVGHQFGNFGSDGIDASMATARAGWTLESECKPRVGIDLDWASGDSDPTDGTRETWNQLFASTHPFFGYLDLIGRQNIISVMPSVSCKVGDTATFRASYSDFHLANDHDSLYGTNGAPVLTDATGKSGNNVGSEVDLTLAWTPPATAPHGEVLVGYSVFSPDRFVERLGDGQSANMLYLQYVFTF